MQRRRIFENMNLVPQFHNLYMVKSTSTEKLLNSQVWDPEMGNKSRAVSFIGKSNYLVRNKQLVFGEINVQSRKFQF